MCISYLQYPTPPHQATAITPPLHVMYPVERPDPAVTTNARLKTASRGKYTRDRSYAVCEQLPPVPTSVYAPERSVYTAHIDESTLPYPLMTSVTVVVAFLVAALGACSAAVFDRSA